MNNSHIFSCNPHNDYEEFLNRVQRHTKYTVDSCLHKKGTILTCRYNSPWDIYGESRLFIDDHRRKKYEAASNDDRFNVHKIDLLTMWHANVDCQPVLSCYPVLKYISKYSSKAERRSESYHHMLTRI